MSHLILIKHAMPKIVPEVPAKYWTLSHDGLASCEPLAHRLEPYDLTRIITSDERKAIQTGERVGEILNIPVESQSNLHEQDRSGSPYIRNPDQFRDTIKALLTMPDQLIYGRENANRAHVRFRDAVKQIHNTRQDENIAIVAHGTVISLYVSRLERSDPFALWSRLGLPSFVVIEDGKVSEIVETIDAETE